MNGNVAANKTVLESILEWSLNRPNWQRDALRRIFLKGKLTDADLDELTLLCKQVSTDHLVPIPLDASHLPVNPGTVETVQILSISQVKDANNLASNEKLSFEPNGITVVYGDNGTGKSGYVRILKRACNARYRGEIYPNIYTVNPAGVLASAAIEYCVGNQIQQPESWKDSNTPHPILSAVTVFDSDCARIQLNEKNEVTFRPFGLDIPDELAAVCQNVKERLNRELQELKKSRSTLFATPPWKSNSSVGKIVSTLSKDTDLSRLRDLCTLTEDEKKRLANLTEDLSKSPAKAAAEQRLKADNLVQLRVQVDDLVAKTADTVFERMLSVDRSARLQKEAARLAADHALGDSLLNGVGGGPWHLMWEAARKYSAFAAPAMTFPPSRENEICVFCQQNLENDALARLKRFEEFVQSDLEKTAREFEDQRLKNLDDLKQINVDIRSLKNAIKELEFHDIQLTRQLYRLLASIRLRRYALFKILTGSTEFVLPPSKNSLRDEINSVIEKIKRYAQELADSTNESVRQALQLDFADLTDRKIIINYIGDIESEQLRLRSISLIETAISDTVTTAITKMGNDIADNIITPKLRDRFQEEIIKLTGDKVRVEIVRSGGKYGSPQYQVKLFAKPDAKVAQVLSEGEQTCVALTAFLTELATATHESALIFDDPVTSLDHRWRKQVGKRLVEECKKRQVVIFSHDLTFVNDLIDLAESAKIRVKTLSLTKEARGTGVVSDGLPWKGKKVEDRIDKLEKALAASKTNYQNDEEAAYIQEVSSIYNKLRACWERTLEEVVFARVIQRHRDYIDTKSLKKASVLTEEDCEIFDEGFRKCCDIVDAHDPSIGRNAVPPAPDEIAKDIAKLKAWIISLRQRQKSLLRSESAGR